MKTTLKPIETLDAFFKTYAQAVTLLQLRRDMNFDSTIRLRSRTVEKLKGKILCPVTAVVYLLTRRYYDTGQMFQAAQRAIAEKIIEIVVVNADNLRKEGRFRLEIRALLLEPFLK